METPNNESTDGDFDIAIVGMAGRFPGAGDVDSFWQNLCDGKESVTFFSDDDLLAAGLDEATIRQPGYVKAAPVLDDPAAFDPRFFGYTPNDAVLMDPQHRLLLELAWEAVESAGYDSSRIDGRVGVFAGCAMNTYLLLSGILPKFVESYLPTLIGNDKDYLATRISHRLGLTGPSISVQTACSSSLVAAHLACQSLLNEECDMALAGGTAIRVPHIAGHIFQEGSVFTPDGHCRPFDARANGTIFGSGGGLVVLKRLADAVADGDDISAVIRGSAVNNDGDSKAEYTAPSIESQSEVVIEALANAGVDADQVAYVETHGTGTYLGDPIEIAALTKAFRQTTDKTGFCAVGSLKSNIGHLDAAAGVCSMIKMAMAFRHKRLPASINFDEPNPQIDFDNNPFFVNTTTTAWLQDETPRFAGVTSLGIGGTNAHVVLGEAPTVVPASEARPWTLLPIAARSKAALDQSTHNLADHLERKDNNAVLADVAFTLQTGRRAFQHRRVAVVRQIDEAGKALLSDDPEVSREGVVDGERRDIVMMFTGQGAQYPGMARGLYDRYHAFRDEVDHCAECLTEPLGRDIRTLLSPDDHADGETAELLARTVYAQPALFVAEYALARLLESWGVRPELLLGHSIGEYVAACIADVFSLEDALRLVAERGRLMQTMPGGAMLGVQLSANDLATRLPEGIELACVNSSALTVLAGDEAGLSTFASTLETEGVVTQRIRTSHAFHSAMMAPVLEPFADAVAAVSPKAPSIPIISNLTGQPLTSAQATDPQYWARHLREPVQFEACLSHVLDASDRVLIEVGPGRTLATFARRHRAKQNQLILTTMRQAQDRRDDPAVLLEAVGRLWLAGKEPDWWAMAGEGRRRVPLPTYPFERRHIWPEEKPGLPALETSRSTVTSEADAALSLPKVRAGLGDWFYIPSWQRSPPIRKRVGSGADRPSVAWLALSDGNPIIQRLVDDLKAKGDRVIEIRPSTSFVAEDDGSFQIDPGDEKHYGDIVDALYSIEVDRRSVLHGWTCGDWHEECSLETVDRALDRSTTSLMSIARALGAQNDKSDVAIFAISSEVHHVAGDDVVRPDKAALLGPCKIIPKDFPRLACRQIDITLPFAGSSDERRLIDQLNDELLSATTEPVVAYRNGYRWTETVARSPLPPSTDPHPKFRDQGVYLITGGLGGMGLELASYLASSLTRPKLILLSRNPLPERDAWDDWLASHDKTDRDRVKIERIKAIEASGAEVTVEGVDVSDRTRMAALASRLDDQVGQIDGIIHAAGVIDHAGTIQRRSLEAHRDSIRSKVHGALVLDEIFSHRNLDFIVHCSSIATVLYHSRFGQVGYVIANGFLDALADRPAAPGQSHVMTINWDEWGEVGMAAKAQEEFKAEHDVSGDLFDRLDQCTPEEGVEVFRRVLDAGLPRVMISTRDLGRRIALDPEMKSPFLKALEEATASVGQGLGSIDMSKPTSENDTVETVTAIWRQATGIAEIAPHDNFFELGGSSLMATQVVAQIRNVTKLDVTPNTLFENPTVAKLAALLAQEMSDEGLDVTDEQESGNAEDFEDGVL